MLLTTRDVQKLINVDKSTIYRMAEDGRLPAVKVGRQWRFPSDRINEMLGGAAVPPPAAPPGPPSLDLATVLGLDAARAVTDLVADLFGVMAVLTDMEGHPLTPVANPCGFFAAVQHQPGAVEHCTAGWKQLGDEIGLGPRFVPSHLGFLCARTFIRVGPHLVGMLIVGGLTPATWPPAHEQLAALAADLDVPVDLLAAHAEATYHLDAAAQQRVLGLLPRLSDLISRLAAARNHPTENPNTLAALVGDATSNQRSTK